MDKQAEVGVFRSALAALGALGDVDGAGSPSPYRFVRRFHEPREASSIAGKLYEGLDLKRRVGRQYLFQMISELASRLEKAEQLHLPIQEPACGAAAV